MQVEKRQLILFFEDAVGITKGYKPILQRMLNAAGLGEKTHRYAFRSVYKRFDKKMVLEWSGNRKAPGFSRKPQVQSALRAYVNECIAQHQPAFIVAMDPSILFLFNDNWDQATIDKLRGGVYQYHAEVAGIVPCIVTLPLTAYHNKVSSKDIAKLNEGFVEKADFEEWREKIADGDEDASADSEDEDNTMEWHEPIQVHMGHIMLMFDFAKLARLMIRIKE
jgi:hypothetical protein